MSNETPKRSGRLFQAFLFAAVFVVILNPELRNTVGNAVGVVLDPVIGFNGHYPVLTILIAGGAMVAATTVLRHFTTDWLEMARNQAMMRHFQKEFAEARKANNTYRMKKLQDIQPEVMMRQQKATMAQMKQMPLTMLVVIPMFAWLGSFVADLPYWFYTSPWNSEINLLTSSVFPHWILLYMTLSIPLGTLVQKAMKYLSWSSRWQKDHPDVHG